jgi:hypothetical protein
MLTCLISEFAALERRPGSVRHERVEHLPHGRIDVSILNPATMLTMAHRGTGVFDSRTLGVSLSFAPWSMRAYTDVPSDLVVEQPGRQAEGSLRVVTERRWNAR